MAPGLFDYFGDDKVALASALIKVASWYGVNLRRAKDFDNRRLRRILSRRLRNQATRPPSIPARSRRPRATTTSTSSPTCRARRSLSTPTAMSLRTGCATIAGTPRTGWSASPIRGRRANPPRSATTGLAAAPPSQARPPAAAARSPHRTSGAARHLPGAQCQQCSDARVLCRGRVRSRLAGAGVI